MNNNHEPMSRDCWYCVECKYGPMLVEVNPACCLCSHKLDSAQPVFHVQRSTIYPKAKDCEKTPTSSILPQIIYDHMDDLAGSESESEDDSNRQSKEAYYKHHLGTSPQQKGILENHSAIAIPALAGNKPTFLGDSIQRDLLKDSAISHDRNSSDHSDDDTSNSDCSTCTWGSNSTGASLTIDTDISFRAWSLAQSMVDALAGTTDWRTPVVTCPTNSNGGSSSKRNNSAVTEGSSGQASCTGKRQRTAKNTKKAQPPDDQDRGDEDEEEEEEERSNKPMKKDAEDLPSLPCIFFIQSLRRPDLSPICTDRSLRLVHRLKEHISRNHRVHQCERCGICFPNEVVLRDHIKEVAGCLPVAQLPPASGVNLSIWTAIKSRKTMRCRTDEEKWKHIYRIVFPDESYVPSPYDSIIPPSDFLVEGAREISLPKEEFWTNLHKALYEKLERAFRELLEDDTQDVLLREILNECISQARTETVSPQTSNSEPTEDIPIPFQGIDALRDFGTLSNFVGADFEDPEIPCFDQASKATTNPLPPESVQGQTAKHARRVFYDTPYAHLEVATNVAPSQLLNLPTFMPLGFPILESDAIQEKQPLLSIEESCELQYVPPTSDPTFFTLFDTTTYSALENSFDFANEPFDTLPVGQQDFDPSFHLDGVEDAEWNL